MQVTSTARFFPTLPSLLAVGLLFIAANPVTAQTLPDTEPPIIEIEALAEGVADDTQVFAAQIAEDRSLLDAILYYRRQGQTAFTSAAMSPLGDTGFYSVSVETDPNDLRTIEYYVQARDESGNRTVSGFAFDPLQRQLLPASNRITQSTPTSGTVGTGAGTTSEQKTAAFKPSWITIALGVLAIGVIASAAGGGGGGSSDEPGQSIRLNIPEPTL